MSGLVFGATQQVMNPTNLRLWDKALEGGRSDQLDGPFTAGRVGGHGQQGPGKRTQATTLLKACQHDLDDMQSDLVVFADVGKSVNCPANKLQQEAPVGYGAHERDLDQRGYQRITQ